MKAIIIFAVSAAVLLFSTGTASAQATQTISQEGKMAIDAVGHGNLELTTTLNGQQWQGWMAMYGGSQHVLKRDMQNMFSAYHLDGFKLDKQESDRKFTVTIEAEGAAIFRGDDYWEFELEKGMRANKLNDRQWLLTSTDQEDGVMLSQNLMLELPEKVTESEQTKSEFGEDVIRYQLPRKGGSSLALYAGGGLSLAGLALLGLGFTRPSVPADEKSAG